MRLLQSERVIQLQLAQLQFNKCAGMVRTRMSLYFPEVIRLGFSANSVYKFIRSAPLISIKIQCNC